MKSLVTKTLIKPSKSEDLSRLMHYANNLNVWNNLRNYFPHLNTEEHGKAWVNKPGDASCLEGLGMIK